MFTTCLFCSGSLGANEVIEHFPVGRRLAFDADQGRLWVVCPKCERWNLTPLDERWEAIEEAERQYRATTRRVATDNIALARLPEGLELVRIGRPLRPEFAAWRYGDQFGRRRRRIIGYGAVAAAAAAGVAVAGPAVGITIGGISQIANLGMLFHHYRLAAARVHDAAGQAFQLTRAELYMARLLDPASGSPSLIVKARGTRPAGQLLARLGVSERAALSATSVELHGDHALRALGEILPALNRSGGGARAVGDAVQIVEDAGTTSGLLRTTVRAKRRSSLAVLGLTGESVPADGVLWYPSRMLLALEMALHEDDERRAMAGELGALYARWEDAERTAREADRLLPPPAPEKRAGAS